MALHQRLFLFPESFEEPRARALRPAPAPAEPPPPAPALTEADLAAAHEAGFAAGHAQGRAAAMEATAAATAKVLAAIAERLANARAAAVQCAEASAAALAQLVLDAVGAGYPALRERFGEDELRRFVAAILPALAREPAVEIRVHPAHTAAVAEAVAELGTPAGTRPTITPCATVAPGDAAIVWHDGSARRDAAAAWSAVAAALAPLGLFSPAPRDERCSTTGEG